MEQIKENAVIILKELHHTPVQGMGINFRFVEENPKETLLNLFNLNDNEHLADNGLKIQATEIKHTLVLDINGSPQILNLTNLLTNENKVIFDANYHNEFTNTDQAISYLEKGLIIFRDNIFQLLPKIYEVEIIE